MMRAAIRSLATANPPLYVTQKEIFAAYDTCFQLEPDERDLYRRLLLEGPIRGRYVAMDDLREVLQNQQDQLIERFERFGRSMAAEAGRKALLEANLKPEAIRTLVTNTCTGYLCPAMSSYLVEDLGLNDSVRVFDLMGMGCGGALPNWECAAGTLGCGSPALSVSFEVCTATLFMGPAPDLVVSNCIFGDGAAAAVLDQDDTSCLLGVLDFETGVFPKYREALRYRWQDGRLRNTLSPRVPLVGARMVHQVAERLLKRNRLHQDQINHWAVHAGGTAVLDRVAETFGFEGDQLQASYDVFREYGNMSSPTVLFALRRILDLTKPRRGDLGLLMAFGAGFTAFAALGRFEGGD
jgi:predicted naringenin-chalcone synthase